jgi:flagellar biosynthesis/type III secretory pathway M-ring protein FliF/YscJ
MKKQEEIKYEIIKNRLKNIFSQKPKAIAKILSHILKRQKSV